MIKRIANLTLAALALGACEPATGPVKDFPVAPPQFSMVTDLDATNLGTLPGDAHSLARGINELGHVVGTSYAGSMGYPPHRAFIWKDGVLTDLGDVDPSGDRRVEAFAINDADQVVGYTYLSEGGAYHAIYWDENGMIDIGTLRGGVEWGYFSYAHDINNWGEVVGRSAAADGREHPFIWTKDGGFTDLGGYQDYVYCRAVAINDQHQVAGYCFGSATRPGRVGFIWEDGVLTELGTLGLNAVAVADINEVGQIVGTDRQSMTEGFELFLWQDGVMTGLDLYFVPYAINDVGQVVGFGPGVGFLWEDGEWLELYDCVGSGIDYAFDINNLGEIVGRGGVAGVFYRAVELTVGLRSATPREETEILIATVTDLAAGGELPEQQARALLGILNVANAKLGGGDDTKARGALTGFIGLVQGLINAGSLNGEDGQSLIDAAQNAIDQLNG